MKSICKSELDEEWIKLITQAKKLGYTPEEIRKCLLAMKDKYKGSKH